MYDEARRTELAKFLRSRRAAISPAIYGLPQDTRRRTPGLRREEVACHANVGVTWYTWLEQGRAIHVSRDVVSRIAAALRLSSSDRAYLYSLTDFTPLANEPARDDAIYEVQDLLNGFSAGPAMLWHYRLDCVAFNRLADDVYDWTVCSAPFCNNVIWRTFMDPKRHQLYSDAEHCLLNLVGMLRSRYVLHFGDPAFESLVNDVLRGSEQFSQFWNEQHTASAAPTSLVMTHQTLGRLAFQSIPAIFPPIPGSILVFELPQDDATKAALEP